MKYQFLIWILLSIFKLGHSQACDDSVSVMKGNWITAADAGVSGGSLTAKYKSDIIPIIDSFAFELKRAYPLPIGAQGKWNRNYWLESFTKNNSATYQLSANFRGYSCKQEKKLDGEIIVMTETATLMFIQANSVWATGNFEASQNFLSPKDNDGIFTIPPRQVLRTPQKEFPLRKKIDASLPANLAAFPHFTFEGDYNAWDVSYRTRVVMQMVFITPDNKLPYDAISIGEFLTINENRLTKYIRENENDDNNLESEKVLLNRIPDLRLQYVNRLLDDAYITNARWDVNTLADCEIFVHPSTGYMLCRRSSRYFPEKENYRPAFITVIWRWQPEVPYSVKVNEGIKNNFDFNALKKLLIN